MTGGVEFRYRGMTARREGDNVNIYDENEDILASARNWTQALELLERFVLDPEMTVED